MGGHGPLLGLDLWIYCVAGFEVSWVSRIERKERIEKGKENVALENTLCLIINYIQLIGLLYNTKKTVNDHQSLTTLTDLHSH